MIAGWRRRIGPWATPVLVAVEAILVWSGLLSFRTAVAAAVGLEALLWVTAISRAVVGARRFRADRAAGVDAWVAAENALAAIIPRRAAHLLLIEPRLWVCVVRWATGRHDGTRSAGAFRYDAALRPVLWAALGLVIVEGTAVEFVLALAVPGTVWLIVSLTVHAYAVFGLLGILASFATRPHLLEGDLLRVRDGVFSEVLIPLDAITDLRRVRRPNVGRSGLKINNASRNALLAHGDANVEITLNPARPVSFRPPALPDGGSIDTLTITAGDPISLVREVNARRRTEQSNTVA